MCHARKERVLLIGTDQRITSGPAARTAALRGRIHGCTRTLRTTARFPSCTAGAVHTWHEAPLSTDIPQRSMPNCAIFSLWEHGSYRGVKRLGLLRRRWLLRLRRHWLLSAVVVFVLLFYLVPFATDYLDDSADSNQKECETEGDSDHPQQISRPAHPGGVLKIRLTDDGTFVDRCELSDIRYELNWGSTS